MITIVASLCQGCGTCVAECPRQAIQEQEPGRFAIDQARCNQCAELFEIGCVRVCPAEAIQRQVGQKPEIIPVDRTPRYRAYNLAYFIAALSPRGFARFEEKAWGILRGFIAASYNEPERQICFSTHFDDLCHGCKNRINPQHVARNARQDALVMARLGVRPGQVMGLWDALRLFEEEVDVAFLREMELTEEYIQHYRQGRSFVPPGDEADGA